MTLHLLKKWILHLILPGILSQIAFKVNEISLSTGLSWQLLSCFKTLTKAEKYFNENKAALLKDKPEVTFKQVENYFKEKKDLIIHQKIIPALPRWYHATKTDEVVSKILCGGNLIQYSASAGHGVYFSTNYELSYGGYCFALDQEMIHPLRNVSYFPNVSSYPSVLHSIWIRVEHDVAVNWNAVAHIVASSDREETGLRTTLAKVELSDDAAIAVTCPIISRSAHEVIQGCFREAYGQTLFPDHWRRHRWCSISGHYFTPTLPYLENNHQKNLV